MFAYFCFLCFFVAVIFIIDINYYLIFERSVWIHVKNFVKINKKYKFK